MQIEEVNKSNKANLSVAFKIEMNIPRIEYLQNLAPETVKEIQDNFTDWRVSGSIAMEKKKGMRVTYTTYCDKGTILYSVNSFHRKNILTGGLGSVMEENLITVFHNENNPIRDKFEKILEIFSDYKGLIQIDTLIDNNGEIWYEWISFGGSMEFFLCLASIHTDDFNLFNIAEADFKRGFGVGCLVYRFPFDGITIDSEFTHESYAYNSDERIADAWKGLYKNLKDLKIPELCYRTDGNKKENKQWHEMRKKGLV